jgi:multisubunit Na+/H+ antiporter MnhB subunit
MSMTGLPQAAPRRANWLAIASFLLALLIMVWPTEADILFAAVHSYKNAWAAWIALLSFAVVFIPFFLALQRMRREPAKWSGRGYLVATGVILLLNLVMVFFTFQSKTALEQAHEAMRAIHVATDQATNPANSH